MKKKFLTIFLIVAMAVTALTLVACTVTEGGGEDLGGDPTGNDTLSVDISALNYNNKYANYASGNGFIIYDDINLDKVKINEEGYDIGYTYFDVYSDGTLLTTVMPSDRAFGSYRFNAIGDYKFTVTTGKAGAQKSCDFTVNVVSGAYPSKVEFSILNASGNVSDNAAAGAVNTVKATLYAGDTEIVSDGEGLTSFFGYDNSKKGIRTVEKSYPNKEKDVSDSTYLSVYCTNNEGVSVSRQFYFNYTVENSLYMTNENPEGIYWGFGSSFVNSEATLDISQNSSGLFASRVYAEYRFKDGTSRQIPVVYSFSNTKTESGKVYIMIKYNGETEYNRYNTNAVGTYTSSDTSRHYNKGNANYQFDPTKTEATVYLAYSVVKDDESGDVELKTVSLSSQFVYFTKTDITTFEVQTVSSNREVTLYNDNMQQVTGNNQFSAETLNVVNDEVSVRVLREGTYNSKHNFIPVLSVDTLSSYGDYYYTISNPLGAQVVRYYIGSSGREYLVAENVGTATITYHSVYTSNKYVLTVNVVNPVMGNCLITDGCPNYGFEVPDFTSYVKVKEVRYNNAQTERALSAEEAETLTVSGFGSSAQATPYTLTISANVDLSGTASVKTINTSFYKIPDITFVDSAIGQVNIGNTFVAANATYSSVTVADRNNSAADKTFIGCVPTYTATLAAGTTLSSVNDIVIKNEENTANNVHYQVTYSAATKIYTVKTSIFSDSTGTAEYAGVPILYVKVVFA